MAISEVGKDDDHGHERPLAPPVGDRRVSDSITTSIVTIGPQRAGRPFIVTLNFVLRSPTWNQNLTYIDDTGEARLIPPAAIHPSVSVVRITHPGLPLGIRTVTISSSGPPATSVTSNSFRVS